MLGCNDGYLCCRLWLVVGISTHNKYNLCVVCRWRKWTRIDDPWPKPTLFTVCVARQSTHTPYTNLPYSRVRTQFANWISRNAREQHHRIGRNAWALSTFAYWTLHTAHCTPSLWTMDIIFFFTFFLICCVFCLQFFLYKMRLFEIMHFFSVTACPRNHIQVSHTHTATHKRARSDAGRRPHTNAARRALQ